MPLSALLLGAAASLGAAGLHLNLGNLLDSSYAPHLRAMHLLPLAMILPAAIGSLRPSLLSTRLSDRISCASPAAIGFAGLATGLCAAALPVILSWVGYCGAWIQAHFMLSNWPLRFLQLALLLQLCTLPLAGLGFTGRLMHELDHPSRERKSRTRPALVFGVLAGMATGILVTSLLAARPATLLPAAALPMLLLAVIAGRLPDSTAPAPQLKPA